MRARRAVGIASAVVVGFTGGAVLTLSLQGTGRPRGRAADSPGIRPIAPIAAPEPAGTFLAWTPGGLPRGFRSGLASLTSVRRAVVVASDNTWMTRSFDSQGRVVDAPTGGFAIPLEVAAVDPREYAAFLPPADRGLVAALVRGEGVLGEASAALRRIGPGGVLRFGRVDVLIAGVIPDALMGANELLVSRDLGTRLGVTHDRYALIQPRSRLTEPKLRTQLRRLVPHGLPLQVRAPGDAAYLRQGDAVLPPVQIKTLFGEFAAKPDPGSPGYLEIDPAWERTHIATERVPILGDVTCNVALFPQLRGAMRTLVDLGLRHTIHGYAGCYARRYVNRDPGQAISHHTWGIAVDINAQQNPYGGTPHQDPRLVSVMERWGFIWGGTFVLPDGMHFEYRRPPDRG